MHVSLTFFVLQQRQHLERRFDTSKMHLSPRWLWLLAVLRRWFCCCWFDVDWYFMWFLTVLCFVVRYFMSLLVLQSSWWGRESWLLYFVCLPGVSWLLCGSSSQWHGFVCSLWLWYFLIILTYYFTDVGPFIFNPSCPGGPLSAADPVGPVGPLPVLLSLVLGDPGRPLVLCPLSLTVLWEALLREWLVCGGCDVP